MGSLELERSEFMRRWPENMQWPKGLSEKARKRGISEEEELRQTAVSLGKTLEETLEMLRAEDRVSKRKKE
jgi:hypothetical protein